MFPLALPASAARFLHSPTHRDLLLLYHQARIRPVEMTITARGTFDEPEQPEKPEQPFAKRYFRNFSSDFYTGIFPIRFLRNHLPQWRRLTQKGIVSPW